MVEVAKPRRIPTQKRGEERVEQILDATADLVLKLGGDAITTNHIAKRAGVNVGTLYHFFSNKFEIFYALLARSLGKLETAVLAAASEPATTAAEWMDRIVDAHARIWLEEVGAVRLWAVVRSRTELWSLQEQYDDRVVAEYEAGLKRYCPHIPPSRRRSFARLIAVILSAVLDDAMEAPTRERKMLILEVRALLREYVGQGRGSARRERQSRSRGYGAA
jgi:AcrR family transcriptional regulator